MVGVDSSFPESFNQFRVAVRRTAASRDDGKNAIALVAKTSKDVVKRVVNGQVQDLDREAVVAVLDAVVVLAQLKREQYNHFMDGINEVMASAAPISSDSSAVTAPV